MILPKLCLYFLIFKICACDWVSEWMSPVQEQLREISIRKGNDYDFGTLDMETLRMDPVLDSVENKGPMAKNEMDLKAKDQLDLVTIKAKLENTLNTAKLLADMLKLQVDTVTAEEKLLKEAISSGRAGVSTVTVSSLGRSPRTYIIRDGFWSICNGVIQYPTAGQQSTNLFNEIFANPRCIGQLISSEPDPCVFHSIVKYETVPLRRKVEYYEEDFLCLKPFFKNTLEQYLSVPRQLVNETCKNGVVRSLTENVAQCGMRVMLEYTYYPQKTYVQSTVPLEYCEEKDGSCKLLVAWHVSNATIENFEFLKNEYNFKKYFMKSGPWYSEIPDQQMQS